VHVIQSRYAFVGLIAGLRLTFVAVRHVTFSRDLLVSKRPGKGGREVPPLSPLVAYQQIIRL
jgi:hypothetical protein